MYVWPTTFDHTLKQLISVKTESFINMTDAYIFDIGICRNYRLA